MKKDKEKKRGDYQCKFYNHISCIKWYDNKSVMLLRSHLEEITSKSTMQRRLKGPVSCSNGIKLYNRKMGGVDLMNQLKSAYQFDRRSEFRFYLRLIFDLFDVAVVNSFIVYQKLENKYLTLKEFKICIALKLIASIISWKLSCLNHRPSKCTKAQRPGSIPPSHLPIFLERRGQCTVCSQAGKEYRTFVMCSLCDVALCVKKKETVFYNITYKPTVTHSLKTLLEHNFHDVKILII